MTEIDAPQGVLPLPMLSSVSVPTENPRLPGNSTSVFDHRPLQEIYEQIREVYRSDDRPWVVGYSGGKDSTAALQLVWYALRGLDTSQRTKPVYVIASDTQVETPIIVRRIEGALARMNEAARFEGLPLTAHTVRPTVEDGFWVNLIGKGYPAPTSSFRWCTERLKIKPANRFILDRVAEFGEVVVVLGVRRSESATRAQVMSLHRRAGSRLSRHSALPNAFVYPPIEDWVVDDVWTYLLQVPNPWGDDNRDLVALYRTAQAGECPLVIDKTTPSCGNSRFGCWVCTVVERDKTMEALIDAGEEWLEPLLEFRDLLADTQEPARKLDFRDYRRKNGRVSLIRGETGDRIMPGPYKLDFCKQLLRRVLELQKQIRAEGPDPDIAVISADEIHEIRRVWRVERQDWDDSVPQIYRDVLGDELDWVHDDVTRFTAEDARLLADVCARREIQPGLIAKLLDIERDLAGMGRRASIFQRLHDALSEDWRTEEQVRTELAAGGAARRRDAIVANAGPLFADLGDENS